MRILIACILSLAASFFLFCFLLGMWLINRGRAGSFVDVHGWPALIGMQAAMLVLALLFFLGGRMALHRRP